MRNIQRVSQKPGGFVARGMRTVAEPETGFSKTPLGMIEPVTQRFKPRYVMGRHAAGLRAEQPGEDAQVYFAQRFDRVELDMLVQFVDGCVHGAELHDFRADS